MCQMKLKFNQKNYLVYRKLLSNLNNIQNLCY